MRDVRELKYLQSLPLKDKIEMTAERIDGWYEHFNGEVYVSFSGGKDSTVLLEIARNHWRGHKDIRGLFIDTGLEYPEIKKFINQYDDIDIIRPKMRFDDVIKTYGYPVISKEVAMCIHYVRQGGITGNYCLKKLNNELEYNGKKSSYNIPQWKYLLDSDFKISNRCCDIMKKAPAKAYEKETHRKPIVGSLAAESRLRKQKWIQNGCNAFDIKRPISNPLSFWTTQDILEFLYVNKIPIADVYGDIVYENGQYKTTGVDRTGCIFCMFGIHQQGNPNKFEELKISHPRQYDYCINGGEYVDGIWQPNKQGLGISKVLDYIDVKY